VFLSPASSNIRLGRQVLECVGFEVLTAVASEIGIGPCSPYVNQRFEGTKHLHLQGRTSAEQETSVLAGAASLLGWFSTLKMEVMRPSETFDHIRTTRRYIPEDAVLNKSTWELCSGFEQETSRRTELLGFWTLSIVQSCKYNTMFRKFNLFSSSGEVAKTSTLLGPLERANWSSDCG
jgi:hypothetical protein